MWVPAVRGRIIFLSVIWMHFFACEDVAGGSQQSGGESFFCPDALPCMRRCSWWVPTVRGNVFFVKYGGTSGGSLLSGGGIIILRVIRRHSLAAAWTQLSASPRTVLFRWKLVVDHVDHAAPRAPGPWTTTRPTKGTTRSRGRHDSGCPHGGEYEG